eukprot:GFYU01027766.1.p1 GENE.GFYU01027766.1~~GFYU01027766.1.p1  ORF type:complete len:233 (-),score=51.80 GFYU01027766.1:290-988(-)
MNRDADSDSGVSTGLPVSVDASPTPPTDGGQRGAVKVETPTLQDAPQLAHLTYTAFLDKFSLSNIPREKFEKVLEMDYTANLWKVETCGVVRDDDGKIIAQCQLKMNRPQFKVRSVDYGAVMGVMDQIRMVRFAILDHTPKKPECYVDHICVTEGARGMGVGKALLDWAEEMALSYGCEYMQLDVVVSNPAIRLYERQGYIYTGKEDCCCLECLIGYKQVNTMKKLNLQAKH